jgi:hypothetical protein
LQARGHFGNQSALGRRRGGTLNQFLKLRLADSYALLKLIDLRRAQAGDQGIGWGIEKLILDRELRDLEAAVVADTHAGPSRTPRLTG